MKQVIFNVGGALSTYKEKDIKKELESVEKILKETKPEKILLSSEFDFEDLIVNYNLLEINRYKIKYSKAIIKFMNKLLELVDYYKEKKEPLIKSTEKIQEILNGEIELGDNFNQNEKEIIEKRINFLRQKFNFNFISLENEFIDIREEGIELINNIDDIQNGKNKLQNLYKIEESKNPDFYFLAEYSGKLIKDRLLNLEFLEENSKFVEKVSNYHITSLKEYDVFVDKSKKDFFEKVEKEGIEKEVAENWFDKWRNERELIEIKFFELIEGFIEKKIEKERIEELLNILSEWKNKLNSLYSKNRIQIHQKFAFVPNGKLQEKFETETEITKHIFEMQNSIESIIFKEEKTASKLFLLKWSNQWSEVKIDDIEKIIKENSLIDFTPVIKDLSKKLQDLKTDTLENFLLDSKKYGEKLKERNNEFNSLIFKMRKEVGKIQDKKS